MRSTITVMLLLAAGIALARADGPLPEVRADDPAWQPLFAALGGKGSIVSNFVERRWFAVRKEPVVLSGVMRHSPDHGVSLAYPDDGGRMMIIDSVGILLRDGRGRSRVVPAEAKSAGVGAVLLPVMRFDMAALSAAFEVRGARTGEGWMIELTPRDGSERQSLERVLIEGSDDAVRRIEIRREKKQRIEIEIGETKTGVEFAGDELRKFFR